MFDKVHFDWDALPPLTSPRRRLGLTAVAVGLINLPPQEGYTFTHRHREQEEVYFVLSGTGRMLIDGETVPLAAGDTVRVDPSSKRAIKNDGDTPLRIICAGGVPAGYPRNPAARYLIDDGVPDYDDIPPWYAGDPQIADRNAELKMRYQKSLEKQEAASKEGNVVLIGMPGAGKSTVGVVLAKRLGFDCIDTDLVIQTRAGRRLQQIIDEDGLDAFRRCEEEAIVSLHPRNAVIATGGSVVYSEAGMAHLRRNGTVVFLDVPLVELEKRVRDMASRGLVIEKGQTLSDLYRQRLPLYRRHAALTIDASGLSVEETAAAIQAALERRAKEN